MRASPLAALALLAAAGVLVPAALAARGVVAPGVVSAVAFDGPRVAFADGFSARDCDRVRIWSLASGAVTRLGRGTSCARTSTGTGVAAVAIAGGRALWLHYTGGNVREWTLWTATTARRSPRRLAFAARDVDASPPLVLGNGDESRPGSLLPYALDRTVTVLRADGSRRFRWTAPARVVALSARGGELAVALAGGGLTVLDAAGRELRSETYAGELSAVRVTGAGVLVQQGRTLELRDGGDAPRRFTLPAGARLEDALGDRAVYVLRGTVRLLRLSTSTDRPLAAGTHAALEGSRAAVSNGRRVTVLPV